MQRAQESFSPFFTGLILSLILIIVTISCTNQVFFENKIDVRSRIAYDQLQNYLQECMSYQQVDCYCPYVTLPSFPGEEDTIQLITAADGVYLDLTKKETNKRLLSKKINDKLLCSYSYSDKTKPAQWKVTSLSDYNLFTAPYYLSMDTHYFMAYIAPDGRLCSSTNFLEYTGSTTGTISTLSEAYSSRLPTCAQKRDYPNQLMSIFLNHRYTSNTGDPERVLTTGKDLISYLQQSFSSLSLVSTSRISPTTSYEPVRYEPGGPAQSMDDIITPNYASVQDTLPEKLTALSNNLKKPLADKLVILSPLVSYSTDTSRDTIILYYLQDSSQSELFAKALEQSLRSLSGKVYLHNQQLQDTPEHAVYKLDFILSLKPLTLEAAAQQGLFLAQPTLKQSHPIIFKELLQISAVFIDFTDNTNTFTLLDNHLPAFAEALALGFQRYLQQLPKSSASQDKTQNIFQNSKS